MFPWFIISENSSPVAWTVHKCINELRKKIKLLSLEANGFGIDTDPIQYGLVTAQC